MFRGHSVEIRRMPVHFAYSAQDLIVSPENDRSCRIFHIIEHLTFSAINTGTVTQLLQMAVADRRDHSDIGTRDLREHGHFSESTDTHFQNSSFVFRPDSENSERQSYMIVEITGCLQHIKARA